jgi:hypothetical protein
VLIGGRAGAMSRDELLAQLVSDAASKQRMVERNPIMRSKGGGIA